MTKKTVSVDADVVKNIALKQAKVDSLKSVLESFLLDHSSDSFAVAKTIRTLNDEIANAQYDFDRAKDEMVSKYIPEEVRMGSTDWSLDFFKNELTYTVDDAA